MVAEPVTGPSHAAFFTLNPDGSFSYTHDGTETTSDSFVYRPVQGVTDGIAATVTIAVTPENDAPTATSDSYEIDRGGNLTVLAAGVLGNDTDPEGDPLTAIEVSAPSRGTLDLDSNGSFSYTHDGSATTSDSFTYKASDGEFDSAPVLVSIAVNGSDPLAVNVEGASTGVTGTSYVFSAVVSGGAGTRSYSWQAKRDGLVVQSAGTPNFTFSSGYAGAYSINLTVADASGTAAASQDFKLMGDVAASPFVADIIWLADEGITQGCNPPQNDMFCPNDRVTRGQMAAFLVRFLGLSDIDSGIVFDDIAGSVFESNILKLATAEITRGCNPPVNDRFCPNDYVTRGQMAAFLVRALGLTDNGGGDLFVDDDGSVFEANIDRLATAGITRGCNAAGDEFCPNSFVTRGQMAAFLRRAGGLSG
jgi:VCBS repeat-containing protein